ncbi:tail fiber assembly protein [Paraburkholderia dilworthii]|uniref:Tail fiber assembly protein n=1 Tax=Paraburkholderia dilworthii TaxID=948106 RepID=A0ABW9DJ06_9BURK
MLIHQYDSTTGAYLSSCLADADPRSREARWLVPAFSTPVAMPERTPLTWPFYRDGAWSLLPDYRGRVLYRQDTGEQAEIVAPGVTPAGLGLTDKPRPSERHTWIDGAWGIAPELLAQEKRAAMTAEFERRMEIARGQNAGKADALAAGLLNDEQTYYFKAWSAYQMALVRAIESDTFPDAVEWPDTPAAYVPPPPPPAPEHEVQTGKPEASTAGNKATDPPAA